MSKRHSPGGFWESRARMNDKSETPITDAAVQTAGSLPPAAHVVAVIHARSLEQRLSAQSALVERLRKALEKYAWHHDDCDAIRGGGELRVPSVPCSCGYSAALGSS